MNRLLLTPLLVVCAATALPAADPPPPVGTKPADFTRTDILSGKPWGFVDTLRDQKAAVVVFLATGCPASTAYAPKLAEMHRRYVAKGITFVAVFSHPTDEAADIAKWVKETGLPFPALADDGGKLAAAFHVDRVPAAAVIDSTRTVRYAGRIDDQFAPGVQRLKPTTREVASALEALLDGHEVRVPHVPAAGCLLPRQQGSGVRGQGSVKAGGITYHNQVARIVQAKCQECHRAGEAGPFALTSYKQAKGWAGMMHEVVSNGTMPPWHADAPLGHFANDRRLTPDEKRTLLAWVDQGCPEGDPKDAPEAKTYTPGWRLGREPDMIVRMNKTVQVPAAYLGGLAGMPYQYVMAGEPFAEDTYVEAVEVRPDFRQAVHHIIVFVMPPEKKRLRDLVADSNFGRHMLAAYVPGDQPAIYPTGWAKKIPKGGRLLFEMHYTPNGKAGADCSMVGLVFAKEKPKHVVKSEAITNNRFRIPPGADNHMVESRHTFEKETVLAALTPHMHLRGKAFRYELVTPDGNREVLLNVPRYDFGWQVSYNFKEPRTIPAGSRIECTAWFDNSKANPFNPDPSSLVRWGNQTWEEMMIGFVEYYEK